MSASVRDHLRDRYLDYRQLKTVPARPGVTVNEDGEKGCRVLVNSDMYAHAVWLILPEGSRPSDNYFDLLPGEERVVVVTSGRRLDPEEIQAVCVNQLG